MVSDKNNSQGSQNSEKSINKTHHRFFYLHFLFFTILPKQYFGFNCSTIYENEPMLPGMALVLSSSLSSASFGGSPSSTVFWMAGSRSRADSSNFLASSTPSFTWVQGQRSVINRSDGMKLQWSKVK